MPESLSELFWIVAGTLAVDAFVFGTLGLEAQIGHGSMWNPHESFWSP